MHVAFPIFNDNIKFNVPRFPFEMFKNALIESYVK